eukprot:INCI1505.2.p2 GENE.INCI1505.2~~INCI1505.2.p2  ORF type:complete len:113 (-),score=19.05 INCI1505.2:49-387(-)
MPAKRKAANVGAEVAQATATSADAPAVLPKQTKISAAPCSTGSTAPLSTAEMLKVLKYMLLTKVHTDAFDDASRAVAEVMFGDRYEHPTHLVRAIHDGSYTRPTTEDVGDAL